MAHTNDSPLLVMSGISKSFGATQALSNVDLELRAGEVHALIGENGAGKSTLMKILAGVHRADRGAMSVAGRKFAPDRPVAALRAGVAMIHQELNLAPDLTVEANVLLGQERIALGGFLQRRAHRDIASNALAPLGGGEIPLDVPVAQLSIARQQVVEIARALASEARVIVFDEPTSSLTEEDTAHLFQVIDQLRDRGLSIVYISHFLEEVAQVADTYTVLRDGCVVDHGRLPDTDLDHIVRQMVGRELDELFPKVPHEAGEPLLELDALCGDPMPEDVNLTVHRGEIFGLAGLVGAGRSELLRCIFGLDRTPSGTAHVSGRGRVAGGARSSIARGLGLVSEDRKSEGLAVELSIADNLTLSALGSYTRGGLLSLSARDQSVRQWLDRINIKAQRPAQAIGELSGGNQQKVAIARLLHQQADILLFDEPTRGIDIGTKAEIYRLIGQLAADGRAIVMVSSYLPELLNVCDRIGVMCRGRLREVRAAKAWTPEDIMHVATGREVAA